MKKTESALLDEIYESENAGIQTNCSLVLFDVRLHVFAIRVAGNVS